MKIAIDCDDTLIECGKHFVQWHNETYGTQLDQDKFKDYDWAKALDMPREVILERFSHFIATVDLPILPYTREALDLLKHHELFLVTARPPTTAVKQKTEAIAESLGVFSGVHYTNGGPKGALCRKLGCEYLIDDHAKHIVSMIERGGKGYLINQKWNVGMDVQDAQRVNNILEAAELLVASLNQS